MRLALAVYGHMTEIETATTPRTTTTHDDDDDDDDDAAATSNSMVSIGITLCVIELEEDECEDEGIPLMIRPNTHDEDFVLRGRFAGTRVNQTEISVPSNNSNTTNTNTEQRMVPLGRRQLTPEGRVTFSISLPFLEDTSKSNSAFVFHHEETGLRLKVVPKPPLGGTRTKHKLEGLFLDSSEGDEDSARNGSSTSHDESSRDNDVVFGAGGGGVGEYEDDGFLVPDREEIEADDRSHDECCVCGLGGELLICDSGDRDAKGCNKCFHLDCIGLEKVPSGDWICSSCATEQGLATDGTRGFEFPATATSPDDVEANKSDGTSEASSKCEFDAESRGEPDIACDDSTGEGNCQSNETERSRIESTTSQLSSVERRPSKRRVILDSDDEETET